jgi:hypothetical protein
MTHILDAEGFAFFQKELEQIKSRTYDVLYPELTYDKVFPVSSEINRGVDTVVYQTFDKRGKARVITGAAKDVPRCDVDGKETRIAVRSIVSSFGYTIDEIEAARYARRPLEQMRATACKRIIEEEMNHIAWYGDATAGLTGFFTTGILDSAAVPNGGAGTAWTTKTPAQILADVNLAFATVFEGTLGVERPNMLGLPLAQWNLIMSTPLTTHGETTIAAWIVKNSPWLSSLDQIVAINEFASGLTVGGVPQDVMAVWTKNPEKCQVEIPGDLQFMEPEKDGLEYIIIGRARFAGLNFYYPKSATLLYGI